MTSASTYSEQGSTANDDAARNAAPQPLPGVETLPERQPPGLTEECLLHGQETSGDNLVIFISQLALKQVATHSKSDLGSEVGGVLLGRAYQYGSEIYLDVQAAIPAVTADHGPVHFTFTADAWAQLHKDRAARYPELDIVGWFHTHPNLGVFYSSDDVVVHSAAFTMPWHIGMVVDPVRKEVALFGWEHEELVVYPGFYERMELQPSSVLEWDMVPTAVWDHPYEYNGGERYDRSSVYLPATSAPVMPALKSYIAYGIAGLALLLSLLMLLGWVLPLTREVDRLQNMVIVLADSALSESNAGLCPDPRLRILVPLAVQQIPAGSVVEITGTAMLPDVSRYQVDLRPYAVEERWTTIGSLRGSTKLGELALWDSETWPPGTYEMRLVPVDNNNIMLPGSPPCVIDVELTS
jgi:proteasome lid subunit RPN8/RPN11